MSDISDNEERKIPRAKKRKGTEKLRSPRLED
jgi:hypothetical protein